MPDQPGPARDEDVAAREPLSADRVCRAAVELADRDGIDAVTMRAVAQALGYEAMSLYNHVANKEALLDGMVAAVVDEIVLPDNAGGDWKVAIRALIGEARRVMLAHRWAPQVIETRTDTSPHLLTYFDRIIGLFLDGGFSLDLIHHSLHALGSRLLGFTQELFNDESSDTTPEMMETMMQQMSDTHPNLVAMMAIVQHEPDDPKMLRGCDDQFEFDFALDIMLDGLDRRRLAEQTP